MDKPARIAKTILKDAFLKDLKATYEMRLEKSLKASDEARTMQLPDPAMYTRSATLALQKAERQMQVAQNIDTQTIFAPGEGNVEIYRHTDDDRIFRVVRVYDAEKKAGWIASIEVSGFNTHLMVNPAPSNKFVLDQSGTETEFDIFNEMGLVTTVDIY